MVPAVAPPSLCPQLRSVVHCLPVAGAPAAPDRSQSDVLGTSSPRRYDDADMARHRLPIDAYSTSNATWLVTIGVHDRLARPFASADIAQVIACSLEHRSAELNVHLWAWCVMPDHLHLVLSTGQRSVIDVVGDFKSNIIRASWALGNRGRLWQSSFHDRGLRTPAHVNEAIRYVLENPVRAGLVEEWTAYRWCGGEGVLKL